MRINRWIGVALVIVCLGLASCEIQPRRVTYTTESEEAKRLYDEGRAALDVLRVVDARKLFAQATVEDPDFALAHLALAETAPNPKARLESTKKALAQNRSISEGERLMILAFEAKTASNATMQLDYLSRAVRLYPEDERLHVRFGDFFAEQVNRKDSSQRYLKAIKIAPEFSLPYYRLGLLYRAIGQFDRAETALTQYVDMNPGEPRPLEVLGDLLMKRGRFEDARSTYERVLEIDPAASVARIGIGNVHLLEGRFAEAHRVFAEMHEQAENDVQRRRALFWTAAVHVHESEPSKAIESLQNAHVLAERASDVEASAKLLNLMGEIWLESGESERAAPLFAEALALVENSGLSSRRKQHARAVRIYYDTRVAIVGNNLRKAWSQVSEYRTAAGGERVKEAKDRFTELGGRVALASGSHDMALERLGLSDRKDPRILFLMAQAYRAKGDERAALATTTQAVNFNEPRFELAFVRPKALKLLEEN